MQLLICHAGINFILFWKIKYYTSCVFSVNITVFKYAFVNRDKLSNITDLVRNVQGEKKTNILWCDNSGHLTSEIVKQQLRKILRKLQMHEKRFIGFDFRRLCSVINVRQFFWCARNKRWKCKVRCCRMWKYRTWAVNASQVLWFWKNKGTVNYSLKMWFYI